MLDVTTRNRLREMLRVLDPTDKSVCVIHRVTRLRQVYECLYVIRVSMCHACELNLSETFAKQGRFVVKRKCVWCVYVCCPTMHDEVDLILVLETVSMTVEMTDMT